jgi:multidrug efflux pump subunit AcrB
MESLVTDLIEDKLKEITGIDELESYSIDNRSDIVVFLDPDYEDSDEIINEIRRAVDGITDLPDDMLRPVITEVTSRKRPIGTIVISSTKKNKDSPKQKKLSSKTVIKDKDVEYSRLRAVVDNLADRLNTLEPIAETVKNAYRKREFRVEIQPHLLSYYNIGTDRILAAISARNFALPLGKIVQDGKEIILKPPGKVKNIDEIKNIVVRANEDGNLVYLHQLAKIKDSFQEELTHYRVDGKRAVTLTINKKIRYDTIFTLNEVEKEIEKFKTEMLSADSHNYEFKIIDNASVRIKSQMDVLVSNAYIGIILVLILLFLFMNWRIAMVTGVGIPIAFGITFILMKFFNFNLDMITILGLIIVVGMIVDDAIIVAENIYRHIEDGMSPEEAACVGTSEVIMPVAATVLTTIAAFSPLILIGGMRGKFSFFIAIIIILALTSSWLEAMLALPAHVVDFARPKSKNDSKIRRNIDSLFLRAKDFYGNSLTFLLQYKGLLVLGMFLLFSGTIYFVFSGGINFVSFPKEGIENFMVACKAPQGTELSETETRMTQIEEIISEALPRVNDPLNPTKDEELVSFRSEIGVWRHRPNTRQAKFGSNYAITLVDLTSHNARTRSGEEIVNSIRTNTSEKINKEKFECNVKEGIWGATRKDSIEIMLKGRDSGVLEKIKMRLYELIDTEEKNYSIEDDAEEKKDILKIHVKDSVLAAMGLNHQILINTLRVAFEGASAANIRLEGEEVKIKVIFPEDLRNKKSSLNLISLTNRMGNLIPLSALANFSKGQEESIITHKEWKKTVTIDILPHDKNADSGKIVKQLEDKILEPISKEFPRYTVEFGGSYTEDKEAKDELSSAFMIAILFIFLILITLFKSVFQPFIVLAAIPLGFIGVIATLLLHGKPITFFAGIGFIGLAGVVVNDSLIMVEFINRKISPIWNRFITQFSKPNITKDKVQRLKKKWKTEGLNAVVNGARIRFRPVLLTTITTYFGLLPTAYGIGGKDPLIVDLALVFGWGLLFASVNTLYVIPGIYLSYLPARLNISIFIKRMGNLFKNRLSIN